MVNDAFSRRPMSSPICAATGLVCDGSLSLSNFTFYMLNIHAAPVLAKLNSGRHMVHQKVEDDPLWFPPQRGLRCWYVPASLRPDVLRRVHERALMGRSVVNRAVENVCRSFLWPKTLAAAVDYGILCHDCRHLKPQDTPKSGRFQNLSAP